MPKGTIIIELKDTTQSVLDTFAARWRQALGPNGTITATLETLPMVEPAILAEIERITIEAARLYQLPMTEERDQAEEALRAAISQLDARVGDTLAAGSALSFSVADGFALYLVDEVQAERVHCAHIELGDAYESYAVDDRGWCARRVAEANRYEGEDTDDEPAHLA